MSARAAWLFLLLRALRRYVGPSHGDAAAVHRPGRGLLLRRGLPELERPPAHAGTAGGGDPSPGQELVRSTGVDRHRPDQDLAKRANKIAKNNDGQCNLVDHPDRDRVLARLLVADIWGIGDQYRKLLQTYSIENAAQLARIDDKWARRRATPRAGTNYQSRNEPLSTAPNPVGPSPPLWMTIQTYIGSSAGQTFCRSRSCRRTRSRPLAHCHRFVRLCVGVGFPTIICTHQGRTR